MRRQGLLRSAGEDKFPASQGFPQKLLQIDLLYLTGDADDTGLVFFGEGEDRQLVFKRIEQGLGSFHNPVEHVPVVVHALAADEDNVRIVDAGQVDDDDLYVGAGLGDQLSGPGICCSQA